MYSLLTLLCMASLPFNFPLQVLGQSVTSLSAKMVTEYALPAAQETHEIIAVNNQLIVISQQTDGALLKVLLDESGTPIGVSKWTITTVWSGLHGLASTGNSTTIWASALEIDLGSNDVNTAPKVLQTIPIPAPAHGPHGIILNGGNLWAACKDSSHIVRISLADPNSYSVWAVSGRPIFVAVHPTSGDVYSGLDLSSKIWRLKAGSSTGEEIEVPPGKGSIPVGVVSGPDGNTWVALLGNSTTGTGTFGRINADNSMDWFTLKSNTGKTAGLIHMAFDTSDPCRLWLLGSSTLNAAGINAIFSVKIDNSTSNGVDTSRILTESSIVLPTQYSWTHRVISHAGGLYVTELLTSVLAHVSGAAVEGWPVSEIWDQFSDYGLGLQAQLVRYNSTR